MADKASNFLDINRDYPALAAVGQFDTLPASQFFEKFYFGSLMKDKQRFAGIVGRAFYRTYQFHYNCRVS